MRQDREGPSYSSSFLTCVPHMAKETMLKRKVFTKIFTVLQKIDNRVVHEKVKCSKHISQLTCGPYSDNIHNNMFYLAVGQTLVVNLSRQDLTLSAIRTLVLIQTKSTRTRQIIRCWAKATAYKARYCLKRGGGITKPKLTKYDLVRPSTVWENHSSSGMLTILAGKFAHNVFKRTK